MPKRLFTGIAILAILAIAVTGLARLQPQTAANSTLPQVPAADSDALAPRSLAPQTGDPDAARVNPDLDQVVDPQVAAAQGSVITGSAVVQDVSPALRDIRVAPETPATTVREMPEPVEDEDMNREARPPVQDPVVQDSLTARRGSQTTAGGAGTGAQTNAPISGVNFEGINNIDGVYPPDTNGDVGPNHYVEMVNLHMQVFSKTGTSLYGPVAGNTIWSGFGGSCATRNDGDPVVLYDKIADRWLISQFTAANPYGECVAVSTTPDPTGSYYRYFFQFSTSVFYDYPKLGIWPDGYYLTANRFTSTFQGASAIALNRAAMLTGAAATYQQFSTSTAYGSLLPSSLDGALPPAGEPNFIAEIGSTALHLWKFHVDWTTPANSTFTGPTTLAVAAYNQLCPTSRSCVPQPSTTVGLDGLGDRLMHRLAYRNMGTYESLLVSHSVNVNTSGTRAGVRWYEIRNPNGAAAIYQQSTFSPDATNRWLGSLAMDHVGNIALGYSVSSSSVFPGIRYTGQLVGDPLGTMTQGETVIISGTGSQTGTGSRWGDYANMAVDPVDDCTFWFTTEYMAATGTAPWRTRIASFKFPNCSTVPLPTATPTTPPLPTNTPTVGPSPTPVPPTATPVPPTATPVPPTATATAVGTCPNLAAGYCRTDNETRAWIAGTTSASITGDDQTRTITLPFTFTFFGTNYTSIKVSSNGNAHFGTASSAYSNVAIPSTGLPNAMIAPFWDDLNPSAGGAVYTGTSGTAPNRVFTIEWRGVFHYGVGTKGATFEIQLAETTNQIWIIYQDPTFGDATVNNGLSATSGIENAAGSAGNAYSFNKAVLTAGKVLHFYLP